MAPKRSATSSADGPLKKKKVITMEMKLDIAKQSVKEETVKNIGQLLCISCSTVAKNYTYVYTY